MCRLLMRCNIDGDAITSDFFAVIEQCQNTLHIKYRKIILYIFDFLHAGVFNFFGHFGNNAGSDKPVEPLIFFCDPGNLVGNAVF